VAGSILHAQFHQFARFRRHPAGCDGWLEASLRLTPERFAEGLGAWLNQRGKGEGQPVVVEVTRA